MRFNSFEREWCAILYRHRLPVGRRPHETLIVSTASEPTSSVAEPSFAQHRLAIIKGVVDRA
jgi:hypothetical protein